VTSNRDEIVFGGLDGLTSALGVMAGAYLANARAKTVLITGLGLAIAAAVSMAGGEALSDEEADGRIVRAAYMGGATLVGSFLPIAGFIFDRRAGLVFCIVITVCVGATVAHLRPGAWWPSIVKTFAVLAVAAGLSVVAAVAMGATG